MINSSSCKSGTESSIKYIYHVDYLDLNAQDRSAPFILQQGAALSGMYDSSSFHGSECEGEGRQAGHEAASAGTPVPGYECASTQTSSALT